MSFLVTAPAQAATFFDGTFDDEDWTRIVNITAGPFSLFEETATQSLSGGNPDAFRSMTHNWGNDTRAEIYHFNVNAIYDPAVQGAIASIDYSADVRGLPTSTIGGVFGDGFAIQQDGRIFRTLSTGIPTISDWQSKSLANLTSGDFIVVDGGAGPDFSITGSPIQFGYFRSNIIFGTDFATIAHGIDNWSVTVNPAAVSVPVPEPSTIVGLGLLGLGAFSKRKLAKLKYSNQAKS